MNLEEIAELQVQGFTVNDNKESVEEDWGLVAPLPTGTWMRPMFFPRKSAGYTNGKGKWHNHLLPKIAEIV